MSAEPRRDVRRLAERVLRIEAEAILALIPRLDERFDSSPAAVGKELYLRGQEYLYCIAGE